MKVSSGCKSEFMNMANKHNLKVVYFLYGEHLTIKKKKNKTLFLQRDKWHVCKFKHKPCVERLQSSSKRLFNIAKGHVLKIQSTHVKSQ